MIRIFRNIRQKLASENKVMAYLRYALGEILLVMIGILLALQVNNWNTKRLEVNRSNDLIKKLKLQTENNINEVDSTIKKFRSILEKSELLVGIIGNNKTKNIDSKIDSLIILNIKDYHLNLNLNTLI